MSRSIVWRVAGTVLVVFAAVILVSCVWLAVQKRNRARQASRTTVGLINCAMLVVELGLLGEERGEAALQFPRGGMRDLCKWIMSDQDGFARALRLPIWSARDGDILVDGYGHEIVYRFPSLRKTAMFDLYSVGPNGKDELGLGDDIACGQYADFSFHAPWPIEPGMDREWLLQNYGRLRIGSPGLPVGRPPPREQNP